MNFFVEVLKFSSYDALLLFLCPIFAIIGGMANVFVLWADYSKLPDEGSFTLASLSVACIRIFWLLIRVLLSCAAGLTFSLFLVGALNPTPATTGRILALSVLIGYAAPGLWITQEIVFKEAFKKSLKKSIPANEKELAAAPAAQLKE